MADLFFSGPREGNPMFRARMLSRAAPLWSCADRETARPSAQNRAALTHRPGGSAEAIASQYPKSGLDRRGALATWRSPMPRVAHASLRPNPCAHRERDATAMPPSSTATLKSAKEGIVRGDVLSQRGGKREAADWQSHGKPAASFRLPQLQTHLRSADAQRAERRSCDVPAGASICAGARKSVF